MTLGVLSIHLDGAPCAVGCPFCYLGARTDGLLRKLGRAPMNDAMPHASAELLTAVERLDYRELAIALSEPGDEALIARLIAAATARGLPTAITTTPQLVLADPVRLAGAARLNLSVDPWKLSRDEMLPVVRRAAEVARTHVGEVIAITTLSTPGFAEQLIDGLLAELLALPALDGVALSALKPPPPFCDRAFWLRALARLAPLLDTQLERRLHLDCYVAARLLKLGGCPARPDLTPSRAALAFRGCVYAPEPERIGTARELEHDLTSFTPPEVCPFDTRL